MAEGPSSAEAGNAATEDVTWQWLNPRGGWQDFRPRAVQQLEAACRAGRTMCGVGTPSGNVTVNFQSMLQSHVGGGSAPRRVRRVVGDTESPPIVHASAEAVRSSLSSAQVAALTQRLSEETRRTATANLLDASPAPRAKAKASASVRGFRPARGGSPAGRLGNGAARDGSPRGSASPARASSDPALPRVGLTRVPVGGGLAAVRGLRSGVAIPRSFANDEALAIWVSTQEGISDEEIARIYSDHYNRVPPAQPARPAQGDYLNIDGMSQEDLIALSERVGFVERSNPGPDTVASLPTRRATADDVLEDNECAVCCDTYTKGDELRILPCFHEFHKCCIDKWLLSGRAGARKCPMCNAEVEF